MKLSVALRVILVTTYLPLICSLATVSFEALTNLRFFGKGVKGSFIGLCGLCSLVIPIGALVLNCIDDCIGYSADTSKWFISSNPLLFFSDAWTGSANGITANDFTTSLAGCVFEVIFLLNVLGNGTTDDKDSFLFR